ncbi:hypothetical protein SAMN05518672_10316 [Chitinophaga sp. CF118]|uniref:hypothetical protein n=1 Tax=Chitinophaga sp. CF118 TaxID=1884367 RepID=UPI0008E2C7E7|nr:hypothetical protein [Chitinophaga sp. CF118]SFD73941.1 hypothetical protein SAMN05518672_10316 [Chitinophaga sp. CF118]
MIINNPTPYPLFKKGQQLKSSSLTGIVDFAALEEQDTRVYLEGSGIFYGLTIDWNATAGTLRLLPGTAVTSDGQLFSLEKEIIYNGISKTEQGKDVEVTLLNRTVTVMALSTGNENHADFVYHITGTDPTNPGRVPDTTQYLLILAVRSDESTEASCLYGYENNESKKVLEVEAALIDKNAFTQAELDAWFAGDTSNAGSNDPVMQRFGYLNDTAGTHISFDRFTNLHTLSAGFNEVCAAAELSIGNAYNQIFNLVKEKLSLTDNPFVNLTANLQSLRTHLSDERLLPWLYDYYRDLISTYQEFVTTDVFSLLSSIPEKDRFRGYIALGSIRTTIGQTKATVDYRMGLYRPPFADLSINALEKPLLLMKRMVYLASNTRFADPTGMLSFNVKLTPDAGINKELAERAIPFYYKDPAALSRIWNAGLTRNNRTFSIPGITDDQDRKYFLSNIDGYTFYRIKGHIGSSIQFTQDAIVKLRSELHLPFDVRIVYLGTDSDMSDLIKERSSSFSDLSVILEKIVNDIRCGHTCSDDFEDRIFKGGFDRNEIGAMFEDLVLLFGPEPVVLDKVIEKFCSSAACEDEDKTCCRAHLTSLYAVCHEYTRRKAELLDGLLFHRFAKNHPGLEHNGGVPRGGTLVLVCSKLNINSISEDKKALLVNLVLSNDEEKIAEAKSLVEELQNYEVVADFCLPYICCSGQPSINITFQELPPVAYFIVEDLEPLADNKGYTVTLTNESIRASTYHWQLLDYNGVQIGQQDSDNLTKPTKFDLLFEKGVEYTIILTASRDGMDSKYHDKVTICPQKDKVTLTSGGKPETEWNTANPMLLPLEISPYGGSFRLMFNGDVDEEVDPSEYKVVWKADKKNAILTIVQPFTGIYTLNYLFEKCTDSTDALKITTRNTTPVPSITTDNAARKSKSTTSDKRTEAYIGGVDALGNEDDSLASDAKFADTKAFLAGEGDYGTLINTLQTGFSKLKVVQKLQVIKLLVYATAYFVDKEIAASPEKVQSAAKKLVLSAANTITSQKEGLAFWNTVWIADDITTDQNKKTVAVYKAMIA